jgi:hypothetical protein
MRKDRSQWQLDENVISVTDSINKIQFVRCDFSSRPAQVSAFKAAIGFSKNGLHHVVANAGVTQGAIGLKPISVDDPEPESLSCPLFKSLCTECYYSAALAIKYLEG